MSVIYYYTKNDNLPIYLKYGIRLSKNFDKEVNLFRQFIDYMYKEGKTKSNVENVLKLIAAQDKTDIKIEKKKG